MSKEIFKKITPRYIKVIYRVFYNLFFSLKCYLGKGIKIHNYAGIPLKVYIFNTVSKRWYDHDELRNEIKFLMKGKLKKGAKVFNIGAHHSVIALIFSKIVGEKGKVIAVEMDHDYVRVSKINKDANNATNINIINAAASNSDEYLSFSKDQISTDNNSNRKIKSITVDNLSSLYGNPDVIYMDVEGYECKVLEGAQKTMKKYPDCFIEMHVNYGLEKFNGTVKEIISYFPSDKYNVYMAEPKDNCRFQVFNIKSDIVKDRFYLVALAK